MKSLKLNKLEQVKLEKKEMQKITGGQGTLNCSCGCQYANNGGSSIAANCTANTKTGKQVPAGFEVKCWGTGTVIQVP